MYICVAQEHDTSLHVAAKWGVEDVAKWLLNVGADFTITNRVRDCDASNVHLITTVHLYQD